MSFVRRFAALLLVSFALARPAAAVDYTDIWYIPAESGWGVNLVQADDFIFATFFIYGPASQPPGNAPTWYTAQLRLQSNGTWTGPVYLTTGTYFGSPWNTANNSVTAVGSATFTPTSAITGTLAYNVGTVSVTKSIQRQTLVSIPIGGSYRGAYRSIYANCNDSTLNGQVVYDSQWTVSQTFGGAITFSVTSNDPFTMSGSFFQTGTLYSMPAATYTFAGKTMTANVTEIKATSQGLEGRWTANVGAAYPGCVETAYFSVLFLPN
jgi:hypothetical protein